MDRTVRCRIGIYAAFLQPGRTGGAETYVRSLLTALQALDLDESFVVFVPRQHDLTITSRRFELVECAIDAAHRRRRILWEQLVLPGLLRRHGLDLVHFPYGTMPYRYAGRSVVTIHDTMRFRFPGQMSPAQRLYRRVVEERIVDQGHHVICVSRADAAAFAASMGGARSRISVVPHGVSEVAAGGCATAYDGNGPLLWVGRPYPSKNLDCLIRAYALLSARRRDVPPLRLVGIDERDRQRVSALLPDGAAGAGVSLEAPVPHAELPHVYRRASLLVYPSKQESFGLPVLEAMAAGVPVVCSEIPAFRELYGDAALLVSPNSPSEFADAIERLLDAPALRSRLSADGRNLARRFSWRTCAEETYRVYRRLLEKDGPDQLLNGEGAADSRLRDLDSCEAA